MCLWQLVWRHVVCFFPALQGDRLRIYVVVLVMFFFFAGCARSRAHILPLAAFRVLVLAVIRHLRYQTGPRTGAWSSTGTSDSKALAVFGQVLLYVPELNDDDVPYLITALSTTTTSSTTAVGYSQHQQQVYAVRLLETSTRRNASEFFTLSVWCTHVSVTAVHTALYKRDDHKTIFLRSSGNARSIHL